MGAKLTHCLLNPLTIAFCSGGRKRNWLFTKSLPVNNAVSGCPYLDIMSSSYPSVCLKISWMISKTPQFRSLIHPNLKKRFRVFCVACGFFITKADIFPAIAARGAGQIALNITIPCLLFSKIVPAFSPDNVTALGVAASYFYIN